MDSPETAAAHDHDVIMCRIRTVIDTIAARYTERVNMLVAENDTLSAGHHSKSSGTTQKIGSMTNSQTNKEDIVSCNRSNKVVADNVNENVMVGRWRAHNKAAKAKKKKKRANVGARKADKREQTNVSTPKASRNSEVTSRVQRPRAAKTMAKQIAAANVLKNSEPHFSPKNDESLTRPGTNNGASGSPHKPANSGSFGNWAPNCPDNNNFVSEVPNHSRSDRPTDDAHFASGDAHFLGVQKQETKTGQKEETALKASTCANVNHVIDKRKTLIANISSFISELSSSHLLSAEDIEIRRKSFTERRARAEAEYKKQLAAIEQEEKQLEVELASEQDFKLDVAQLTELQQRMARKAQISVELVSSTKHVFTT